MDWGKAVLFCAFGLCTGLGWSAPVKAQPVAVPAVSPPVGDATTAARAVGDEDDAASAADGLTPEVQAQYRDVVGRAVVEFDAGRWAEARALFLRAHQLWPSARTLRTLGMTSFELRAYAQALTELQAALDDPRRPLSDEQRAQVSTLIDQARAFVGRYQVAVTPSTAELLVDGAPRALAADGVLLLEVGRHELRARASGYSELVRTLDVLGREDETLALELRPLPPVASAGTALPAPSASRSGNDRGLPRSGNGSDNDRDEPRSGNDRDEPRSGGRLFTWIAGGTAVALAGSSLALWLISDSKYDAQLEECQQLQGMHCVRGSIDTSAIEDTQTAYKVTAVAASVVGAAAVALFFIEGDAEQPTIAIGPGGVSTRIAF